MMLVKEFLKNNLCFGKNVKNDLNRPEKTKKIKILSKIYKKWFLKTIKRLFNQSKKLAGKFLCSKLPKRMLEIKLNS